MDNLIFEPKNISRRAVLRGLMALPALGLTSLAGCESLHAWFEPEPRTPGLGAIAASFGKSYGAAIMTWSLADDTFVRALKREVNMLVPEAELKWDKIHPKRDVFDFSFYRRLAYFATENKMAMRGHTLIWHFSNPDWLEPALTDAKTAEEIMREHITRTVAETAPLIRNWDVVNEALDTRSTREDGLRDSPWLRALGPDYVSMAFKIANEADPELTLTYNEFGLEDGGSAGHAKRMHCLKLLAKCRKDGAPVHALGLQSHLTAGAPLGGPEFTAFLKEIRGQGMKVFVTELDLDVGHLTGSMEDRVKYAQDYVKAYLHMVQEGGSIDMLLTWGLSDKYCWMRHDHPELAGVLPLDARFKRGPLWQTLKTDWLRVKA